MFNEKNKPKDVFISYARADDEPPVGATFGWVTLFAGELKKRLRSKLGGNGASIWMDYQLAANARVTDTLVETVRSSRTIVLFMSRSYAKSKWCQKELGTFLEHNKAKYHKESVFIVELAPTDRESWHPRLQELTPIRFWRENLSQIPELLGFPIPKMDQDDPYWRNLNTLAHLIADHIESYPAPSAQQATITITSAPDSPVAVVEAKPKSIVWIAEPTDDVIDQWESLAEAIRQAGHELKPIGLDTYPRSSEKEFLDNLDADVSKAQLLVQLLGQGTGRKPKNGSQSCTALQSAAAAKFASQQKIAFLQWRSQEINLENVSDEIYRQLLTGAISCGFEEFRQRVLNSILKLTQAKPVKPSGDSDSLAICINAIKSDQKLSHRISEILVELGEDALTAPTEPSADQAATDFNNLLDQVILGTAGLIIVYGNSSPAWVQAQFLRARKILAQNRTGIWGALLDGGPPEKESEAGVVGRNIMPLDCRNGVERKHIERFVNTLRGGGA